MLQGQSDLHTVGQLILSELAPVVGAQQAEFYVLDQAGQRQSEAQAPRELCLRRAAAPTARKWTSARAWSASARWRSSKILLTNVPAESFRIASGLGDAAALNVLVLPVVFEGQVQA